MYLHPTGCPMNPRLLLPLLLLLPLAAARAEAPTLPSIDDPVRTGQKAPNDAGLVIGIETYVRPGVQAVPYAKRDAQAFYDFLVSTRGVAPDRVRLIKDNASAAVIRREIEALGKRVGPGGVAWVYFAGHGGAALTTRERMVLGDDVMNDAKAFDDGGVPLSEMEAKAGAGGGQVVMVLDACDTGVAGRDLVPGYFTAGRPKTVMWSATGPGEVAGPLDLAQHGVFTYFALGALRGWADGEVDGVRDGKVTAGEAQLYVSRALPGAQLTGQTPEITGGESFEMDRNAKEAKPAIPILGASSGSSASVQIGGGGSSIDAQLAALARAKIEREAAEARERALTAQLESDRKARLGGARAKLLASATSTWAKTRPLLTEDSPEGRQAAQLFVDTYGKATVRDGDVVAAVEVPEVAEARNYLGQSVVSSGKDVTSPTVGLLKWIPAGTFTMGSGSVFATPEEIEAGTKDDETQHQVTLTKGYWMMEHEVTQGEWTAIMGSNPSNFTACGPTCPVERVSWDDAQVFAKMLSAKEGVTYRLPTEAQWEYAARGGGSDVYAGGNEADAVAWTSENAGSTHPTCGKARNGYGLCDMSGNVWEWAQDWYASAPGGTATNPTGPSAGSFRVNRGGGWCVTATFARVAYRNSYTPSYRRDDLGFRLVRSGS